MRWLSLLAVSAAPLFAQLPAPNRAGVSTGHVHLIVKDPEARQKLWVDVPQLGLKIAFVLDPAGTRIELTEGLAVY